MSRRNRSKPRDQRRSESTNKPQANQNSPSIQPSRENLTINREEKFREIEVRWTKLAAIFSLLSALLGAIIGPVITLVFTRYTDSWYSSKLVFNSRETILVNGRVFDVIIANEGKNPAKDVMIVIDAFSPNFKFSDKHHVHTMPNIAFEKSVKDGRLEVKLAGPLGSKQSFLLLIDNLEFKDGYVPMLSTWVSSDRGQATNKGNNVVAVPNKSLDEFLKSEQPISDQKTPRESAK